MILSQKCKQNLAVFGMGLLAFIAFLDITIVSNALPAIEKSLSATMTQLQWTSNAFYIALCAMMAIMGRLGDLFGLRKVLYFSMGLFSIASLGAGFSPSIDWLIFFRALQGMTAAAMSLTAALVVQNVPVQVRPKAMAVYSIITGSALALGPVVGGLLVDSLGWRWVFFINVPILILGLLVSFISVTESQLKKEKEKLDWIGAILLITTITAWVVTLIEGPYWGWISYSTFFGFAIAISSLICFGYLEKTIPHPLVNFKLLANRIFIPASLTCAICGLFISTLLFLNPLYLQIVLNKTASASGLLLFSISAMVIITSPVAGWITHRFSAKTGTWILLLCLVVSAFIHHLFSDHSSNHLILAAFIPFGMAWGIVNVAPVVAVLASTEEKNTGAVMGALWTIFNLGSAIGLAIAGLLFSTADFKNNFMQGFDRAIDLLFCAALLGLVLVIFVMKKKTVQINS